FGPSRCATAVSAVRMVPTADTAVAHRTEGRYAVPRRSSRPNPGGPSLGLALQILQQLAAGDHALPPALGRGPTPPPAAPQLGRPFFDGGGGGALQWNRAAGAAVVAAGAAHLAHHLAQHLARLRPRHRGPYR